MTMLVSGTGSGLGYFLHRHFGAAAFDRGSSIDVGLEEAEVVIHAACGAAPRAAHGSDAEDYIAAQATLCERLIAVPHRRFVYISSVDVYQGQAGTGDEGTVIDPALLPSAYARMKYECEQRVQDHAVAPLILRPSALLGRAMRPNGAMRMLQAPSEAITLAAQSCFNYVSHTQVAALIGRLLADGVVGAVNVASAHGVTLAEIAAHYGCNPVFGAFEYQTPTVDNRTAARFLPELQQDSLELFVRFWSEYTAGQA